jgi:hypothetical protein
MTARFTGAFLGERPAPLTRARASRDQDQNNLIFLDSVLEKQEITGHIR